MRTMDECRDLIRDAQAEAATGEWLVEHMGAIATETRRIGEEILSAYDTDPEASEGPSF